MIDSMGDRKQFSAQKVLLKWEEIGRALNAEFGDGLSAVTDVRDFFRSVSFQCVWALLKQTYEKKETDTVPRIAKGLSISVSKVRKNCDLEKLNKRLGMAIRNDDEWELLYKEDMKMLRNLISGFSNTADPSVHFDDNMKKVLRFVESDIPRFCELMMEGEPDTMDVLHTVDWGFEARTIRDLGARFVNVLLGTRPGEYNKMAKKIRLGLTKKEYRKELALLTTCVLASPGGRAGPSNHYVRNFYTHEFQKINNNSDEMRVLKAALAVREIAIGEYTKPGCFKDMDSKDKTGVGISILQRVLDTWGSEIKLKVPQHTRIGYPRGRSRSRGSWRERDDSRRPVVRRSEKRRSPKATRAATRGSGETRRNQLHPDKSAQMQLKELNNQMIGELRNCTSVEFSGAPKRALDFLNSEKVESVNNEDTTWAVDVETTRELWGHYSAIVKEVSRTVSMVDVLKLDLDDPPPELLQKIKEAVAGIDTENSIEEVIDSVAEQVQGLNGEIRRRIRAIMRNEYTGDGCTATNFMMKLCERLPTMLESLALVCDMDPVKCRAADLAIHALENNELMIHSTAKPHSALTEPAPIEKFAEAFGRSLELKVKVRERDVFRQTGVHEIVNALEKRRRQEHAGGVEGWKRRKTETGEAAGNDGDGERRMAERSRDDGGDGERKREEPAGEAPGSEITGKNGGQAGPGTVSAEDDGEKEERPELSAAPSFGEFRPVPPEHHDDETAPTLGKLDEPAPSDEKLDDKSAAQPEKLDDKSAAQPEKLDDKPAPSREKPDDKSGVRHTVLKPRSMQNFVARGEKFVCSRQKADWVEGADSAGAISRIPLVEVTELL